MLDLIQMFCQRIFFLLFRAYFENQVEVSCPQQHLQEEALAILKGSITLGKTAISIIFIVTTCRVAQ